MQQKRGLLRRLLGPESHKIFDPRASHLPRQSLAEITLDDDPSGQQFAAMIHAAWLVFAADHQLDDHEVEHLLELIDDLTEGEASHEAIEELFDSYATLLAEVGTAESAAIIADVLREPELRESALKLAIGAACLDTDMSEAEERVLTLLAAAFGYSSTEAQAMLDEVEVKRQSPPTIRPPAR